MKDALVVMTEGLKELRLENEWLLAEIERLRAELKAVRGE
jgi:hypothetical protein